MIAPESSFYVTGGSLQLDAPSYVERQADSDLYDGLKQGEFCYVLTPRQMGKSSLRVRTAARLREEDVAVAVIDLTGIGRNLTAEQWYQGLLDRVGRQLNVQTELDTFALAHPQLGPFQRWITGLREVVLNQCPGPVVIFVDEIDAVRSLSFSTDEFFAGIRECHNRRAEDTAFHRLTFCLLGVAAPSDLIRDTRTTPFNIGRRIELDDFNAAEAIPLAAGLRPECPVPGHGVLAPPGVWTEKRSLAPKAYASRNGHLLRRVLYWTAGHPYLTQRLCHAVAGDPCAAGPSDVDRLCAALFLSTDARERDSNLLFVRERLLHSEVDPAGLLHHYDRARRSRRVPNDDTNRLVTVLRLSGITRAVDGYLRVRNRIYARVFDRAWVREHMPDAELRRQRAAYRRGLWRAASISAVVLGVIGVLALTALSQAHRADRSAREARAALVRVGQERDRANREAERAHQAQIGERAERLLAEAARRQAERDRRRALRQERLATREQAEGERQRLRAQRAERVAIQKLWASYLAQARALRWSGQAGCRFESLAVLAKAAAIHPTLAVRNEAIACLALADLRLAKEWDGTLPGTDIQLHAFDARLERYARTDPRGNISIRRVADDRELLSLPGPGLCVVWILRFSPDGRYLATSYWDGRRPYFRVWDLSRRTAVPKMSDVVHLGAMDFSPDSRRVAVGHPDGTIHVYDLPSGSEWKRFDTGQEPYCLRFHPNGRQLAVSSGVTGTVQVRDVVAGDLIMSLSHPQPVYSVAWRPDGNLLATACLDFHLYVWDVTARRAVAVLEGHGAEPTEVAFNHRGDLLASTGWDSTIRLWDPLGGRQRVSTSGAAYFALPFSPDDRRLGFAVRGLKVGLWDVADGRECRTLVVRQVGSGYWKGPRDAEFSPDGRLLASASTDGVRVWDVAAGREIAFLPIEDARSAIFDPAGGSLITCGHDGLHRWPITPDLEMGSRGVRIGPPQDLGVAKELGWARLSRDGRMLVVGHRDDAPAYVVDMREPTKPVLLRDRIMPLPEISPDGRWAAGHAGGNSPFEGSFRAWDLRSGKRVWDWPVNSGTVAFSPDSKWLVTGSGAETRFWKVGSWQPGRRILWEPGTNIGSMAFSRDGKMLAIVHLPRLVKLIDPATGRELATLDTPNLQNVGWLRFSPDGSLLAITDWNHTIHLWDLRSVRRQLAAMGLDWRLPLYPPAHSEPETPLRVTVIPGKSMLQR